MELLPQRSGHRLHQVLSANVHSQTGCRGHSCLAGYEDHLPMVSCHHAMEKGPGDMKSSPHIYTNTPLPFLYISIHKAVQRGHIGCIVDHTVHPARVVVLHLLPQPCHRVLVCDVTRDHESAATACHDLLPHTRKLLGNVTPETIAGTCHYIHFRSGHFDFVISE